ncbi:MAG: hypothetical protein AAGC78_15130 [Cellvibrio sp.]|uniref:hypothetical protein n=1 Tax=Cellvibrio sp. TaxID=1965322 RepID=UPI0031A984BC
MSKLFKLKEWLTIEEAARHLSTVLGEDVALADIYRLALDGHLVLSMSFPNHAYGNLGEIVGINKAKRFKPSEGLIAELYKENPEDAPKEMIAADYIGDGQFINWNEAVTSIDGVWDLAMLASERIDVEHVYQHLTGGPEIELTNLNGTFLRKGEAFCRLVESWDDNEYQKGSLAAKRQLEELIEQGEIPEENIKAMWDKFKADRKEYLAKRDSRPRHDDYYPAGCLPRDGVYVVRTAAIVDFLSQINETPKQEKPLSAKERNSMLTVIAALCDEAKFDYRQRGIAGALAASTEKLGKPLSDDTIRGIIKQVKDLLQ